MSVENDHNKAKVRRAGGTQMSAWWQKKSLPHSHQQPFWSAGEPGCTGVPHISWQHTGNSEKSKSGRLVYQRLYLVPALSPVILHLCFVYLGEIISNLHDLQSLTVDASAEKEKQRADMKHILQQKQRALSELFKMLTEIGECRFS